MTRAVRLVVHGAIVSATTAGIKGWNSSLDGIRPYDDTSIQAVHRDGDAMSRKLEGCHDRDASENARELSARFCDDRRVVLGTLLNSHG